MDILKYKNQLKQFGIINNDKDIILLINLITVELDNSNDLCLTYMKHIFPLFDNNFDLKYDVNTKYAEGNYNDIYKSTLNSQPVITKINKYDNKYYKNILTNIVINILLQCDNTNITEIIKVFYFKSKLHADMYGIGIIMKQYNDDAHYKLLHTHDKDKLEFFKLTLQTTQKILLNINKKYIFVHGDLHLKNLLLTDKKIYLSDFEFSELHIVYDGKIYILGNKHILFEKFDYIYVIYRLYKMVKFYRNKFIKDYIYKIYGMKDDTILKNIIEKKKEYKNKNDFWLDIDKIINKNIVY